MNSAMPIMWEVGWTVGPYLSGVVQARFGPPFVSTAALHRLAIGLTGLFFHAATRPPPAG